MNNYKKIERLANARETRKNRQDYFSFLINGKYIEFVISSYDMEGLRMVFTSSCGNYFYTETTEHSRYDKEYPYNARVKIKYACIEDSKGFIITER